ncbi:MAG: C40 family peptidase [Eubacterium sp.]|nr:C40 family peptidase [Eubacterium sp.]
MNKKKRILGVAGLSIFMCATLVVPNLAASLASEEHMEGANVVIDEYCEEVAAGTVAAQDSSVLTATEAAVQAEEQAEEQPQDIEDEEEDVHVELNLNYSRLGIASKVDTYLNVRKKPSESSSIVGKLTKNAGCHIYKIKKGWAKIVSGQVKGWVKASYLVTDEKAEELATKVGKNVALIETNSLRVRALPTTDAPIYSVVSEGEEFTIKKQNLTLDFVKKVIAKEKISKSALKKAGGYEKIEESLSDFVCIYVDDEYAFVAKEYVKQQYSLKRAVKAKTVKASKSSGVSSGQASIVEFAKKFLGNRYVWGGSSLTGGTDCSGFTMSLYAHYGYSLPHNAAAQAGVTRKVSSPKPGDLFFYSNGSRINHVAMYIGGGMVIHASNPTDGIKISNAYYRQPVKIGRVMN